MIAPASSEEQGTLPEVSVDWMVPAAVSLACALFVFVPLVKMVLTKFSRIDEEGSAPERATWTLLDLVTAVFAGLAVLLLLARLPVGESALWGLVCTVCALGTFVLVTALPVWRRGIQELAPVGLCREGSMRALAAAVLGYPLIVPIAIAASIFAVSAYRGLGGEPAPQPVLEAVRSLEGVSLFIAVVLAVVVGPLLEELVFRGFLQPVMVQLFGASRGVILTAGLFALLHGTGVVLAPIFVLGMFLGGLQDFTRRLAAAWLVHGVHNGLTLFLAFQFPTLVDAVNQ